MPVAEHAPTPQVVGVEAMPLSTTPLQSLSKPSQTSAVGAPGVQVSTIAPPTQLYVPVEAHWPTPQVVGVEAMPLSTTPLQSLSKPSQTSAVGEPAEQLSTILPF